MIILNPTCGRIQFFMEASAASQSFPCKIWELLVDAFNKRRQTEVTNLSCTREVLTSCQMSNSSTSIQKSNFTERVSRFIILARLPTCYRRRQFFAKQLDCINSFCKYCTIPPDFALIEGQRELRPSHAASGSLCSHWQPGFSFRLSGLIICISCWLLILAKSTRSTDDIWRHEAMNWSCSAPENLSVCKCPTPQFLKHTVYQIHSNHFNST